MARKGENIYKRKDGRWEGRYIKDRDISGKAIYGYVYAKSYGEVRKKLVDAKMNTSKQSSTKESLSTFSDWIDLWMEQKRVSVKQSTYVRYKNSTELHIKPNLGSLRIKSIDTNLLQTFFSEKAVSGRLDMKGGLSPKTLSEILMIIKSIFNYAETHGETLKCDLDQIVIKKTYQEMRILTIDEERRLNRVLLNDLNVYKLGILLCLYTGIRIGELCALKWENISFEEKSVKINKTMQRLQSDDSISKTKIIVSDPKSNCSNRQIPLPDFLIKELKSFRANDDCYT